MKEKEEEIVSFEALSKETESISSLEFIGQMKATLDDQMTQFKSDCDKIQERLGQLIESLSE